MTIFAVFKLEKFIYFAGDISNGCARTLVLNLRLGEGFQAGGNYFPQSSLLALDGDRGHGGADGAGWIGKREDLSFSLVDVGELINLGICYFGKRQEPSAWRLLSLSSTFFLLEKGGRKEMKEPTSPTAPLAAFPPLPAEHRSRAPEFYGFVAWSSTYLLFVLFILWGFFPDEWIVWSGVSWYPNRYFRLTVSSVFYLRSV